MSLVLHLGQRGCAKRDIWELLLPGFSVATETLIRYTAKYAVHLQNDGVLSRDKVAETEPNAFVAPTYGPDGFGLSQCARSSS